MRTTTALGLLGAALATAPPALALDATPGGTAPAPAAPAAPSPAEKAPQSSDQSLVPTVERDPLEGGGSDSPEPAPGPAPGGPAAGEPTAPAAAAAPGMAPARSAQVAEEDEDVPPAHDTVGGHVAVGAIAGYAMPFGSLDSRVAQTDVVGPGLFLGGDITYGVSRTVMIGAYGEVSLLSGEGIHAEKDASSIAAGAMLRYHLVQGLRFDPWMAYGIGFRRQKVATDSVTGLDWARIQLGGDWYASSNIGFGPVLDLSLGTFLSASPGTLESKSVNAVFVVGGRLVFDSPGK
ncbi:MAG TPA: hypothetical protein VHE30_23235 [Polyangiaceae bacterium]|nr:hypothetical protein [Polyangiaceae bacterium]